MNERFELNGKLIKETLQKDHRKLSWLEEKLEISRSLVDKMISQGHVPNEETLASLMKLLKLKRSQLLLPRKQASA